MFKLPFKKTLGTNSFSGINIGTHSVKVVSFSKSEGKLFLDKFTIEDIIGEPVKEGAMKSALSEALKRVVAKTGLANHEVVTGLSGPAVVVRYLDLPQMSKSDLESAVRFEAKPHIPFDLKDVILDFQVLDQGQAGEGKKMKILLVAAQRNFVYKHIELLEKESLKPVIIDIDSFALVNAFLHANPEASAEEEAIGLVNLGASLTNVSILNKGVLLFTRDIPMGGNNLTESLAKRLNVEFRQAEKIKSEVEGESSPPFEIMTPVLENLANEIRRSFDYYESQVSSVEKLSFRVFLSGGVAKLKGIDGFFNKVLDFPVSLWDPFNNIIVDKKRFNESKLEENLPYLCIGAGLALRSQENI